MKNRIAFINLALLALFLTPAALASNIWYVDGVNGSDSNDCMTAQTACQTIGHAISLASNWDSVMVAAATYKENLTIGVSLNVIGSGASTTIIDGGGVSHVVAIPAGRPHVVLSKLTIQNGNALGTFGTGGGVYNYTGTLTIKSCMIRGNSAVGEEGEGGGIYSRGTLTINNSTISGNSAGWGGGISSETSDLLTINNSTISGNIGGLGGGIFTGNSEATIINSTISGSSGGGIYSYQSEVTLQNSIVANTVSGGNCIGGTMTSDGYNLSSDNTCNFAGPGDLNNTDPKLGALKNNGGPTQTQTQALLKGSPAINAGNPNGCTDSNGNLLKTDQRGYPRPDQNSGRCDIGAFERQHN